MVFSTFTMLCIHHLYLLPKHFHYTKKNPYSFFPRFTLFLADMLCHILGTKENRILMWVFICIIGVAAAAKSLQLCPTLCDPVDSSPPGSFVHGIFQSGVLEWGAIAFSDHRNWAVCFNCSCQSLKFLFCFCLTFHLWVSLVAPFKIESFSCNSLSCNSL